MFTIIVCKGPQVLSSENHFFTIPSCVETWIFSICKHLLLAGTFKQFTWDEASSLLYRQTWSFKQATSDTNYHTVILPKPLNIKLLICDTLITWPSTCTQSSQIEHSAMDRDVQAVQSGVKTQWTKDRTCPGITFFFWAAQFLHSWPMFLDLPFYFNTGSNSIISLRCSSALNACSLTDSSNTCSWPFTYTVPLPMPKASMTSHFQQPQWILPCWDTICGAHTPWFTVATKDFGTEPSSQISQAPSTGLYNRFQSHSWFFPTTSNIL